MPSSFGHCSQKCLLPTHCKYHSNYMQTCGCDFISRPTVRPNLLQVNVSLNHHSVRANTYQAVECFLAYCVKVTLPPTLTYTHTHTCVICATSSFTGLCLMRLQSAPLKQEQKKKSDAPAHTWSAPSFPDEVKWREPVRGRTPARVTRPCQHVPAVSEHPEAAWLCA